MARVACSVLVASVHPESWTFTCMLTRTDLFSFNSCMKNFSKEEKKKKREKEKTNKICMMLKHRGCTLRVALISEFIEPF
jgi:hypothetical protein